MSFDKDWEEEYLLDTLFLLEEQIKLESEVYKIIALDRFGNPLKIETNVTGKLQGNTSQGLDS